jgi:hypothetical protein
MTVTKPGILRALGTPFIHPSVGLYALNCSRTAEGIFFILHWIVLLEFIANFLFLYRSGNLFTHFIRRLRAFLQIFFWRKTCFEKKTGEQVNTHSCIIHILRKSHDLQDNWTKWALCEDFRSCYFERLTLTTPTNIIETLIAITSQTTLFPPVFIGLHMYKHTCNRWQTKECNCAGLITVCTHFRLVLSPGAITASYSNSFCLAREYKCNVDILISQLFDSLFYEEGCV